MGVYHFFSVADRGGYDLYWQELLMDVYQATYGGPRENVDIFLRSTPRIEVSTVDDIVKLLDTGIVSTGTATGLSRMLLGIDTEQYEIGDQSRAFVTCKNRGKAAS